MKRFLTIALFLTLSAIGANAQCDTDAIAVVYKKFVDNHKERRNRHASRTRAAKEYLSKFGECPGDAEKAVTDFIKKWQVKYDAAVIDWNCTNAVDKTPAKAFELCQPLLAKDPESLRTNLLLSLAGIKTASDLKVKDQTVKAHTQDARSYKVGQIRREVDRRREQRRGGRDARILLGISHPRHYSCGHRHDDAQPCTVDDKLQQRPEHILLSRPRPRERCEQSKSRTTSRNVALLRRRLPSATALSRRSSQLLTGSSTPMLVQSHSAPANPSTLANRRRETLID
jgi:hypothetical protein